MHFYSSPGRTKTSLKPLGLVPFHSSCLYAANSRSLESCQCSVTFTQAAYVCPQGGDVEICLSFDAFSLVRFCL